MSRTTMRRFVHDRKGQTVIFVAIGMIMFLGIAALAVDIGWLYMVRNQLQNGADSGALAGAQVLYINNGTAVNPAANAMGSDYVQRNYSEQTQITVESVTRGHWSFYNHTFAANEAVMTPPVLWGVTADDLDHDPNFVNAVQVVTRRKRVGGQLPEGIFARIWNARTEVKATAVGYIGFAGKLEPASIDKPIAICKQAITTANGSYTCGVGRMLSSENSMNSGGHQTAGWTNFTQDPCDTASASSVRPYTRDCSARNTGVLLFGEGMGTTNGTVQNVYDDVRDCWMSQAGIDQNSDGWPDQPWPLTLPVIDCPGGAVGNCSTLVGAVVVNVLWITRNDKNQLNEVPKRMADWPANASPAIAHNAIGNCTAGPVPCWSSFVRHFNLQDLMNGVPNDPMDFYQNKTIYFDPDCSPHEPTGVTGGENYGILARIPVLVK